MEEGTPGGGARAGEGVGSVVGIAFAVKRRGQDNGRKTNAMYLCMYAFIVECILLGI